MKLRPYQQNVLDIINVRLLGPKKEIVLAAAPSSGKTFIAIQMMLEHKDKSFLILTHGTTVLKNQWEKELEIHGLLSDPRIQYGIPQRLYKKDLKQFDVLIIDEAHEFTYAKGTKKARDSKDQTKKARLNEKAMISQIKKKAKAKNILYLTGTPSKFIRDGHDPIIIPAIELIENDYISDLYVGMVSTNVNLTWNSKDDIDSKTIKYLEKNVNNDLDRLLDAMVKRLRETKLIKNKPTARKVLQWAPIMSKLHKTMIACASVKQAENVEAYFKKRNINVVMSNYKNDPDSLLIQKFQEHKDIKVLIVVNRGILGFNMPDLVNVVDLTGSRNIDRIYQLYARVMRKHEDFKNKYFFKITDEPNMKLMEFYMNASLMLMFPEFISKYNGKNLNGCEVLVLKPRKVGERDTTNSPGGGQNSSKANKSGVFICPDFMAAVTAGKVLKSIYNKVDEAVNEYAFVTFGDIKREVFGDIVINPEGHKKAIDEWTEKNGKRPILNSKDSEEKRYGSLLNSYINPKSSSYDATYEKYYKNKYPQFFVNVKTKIFEFRKRYNKRPNANSKDPEERRLGTALSMCTSINSVQFDKEFTEKYYKLYPNDKPKKWSKDACLKIAKQYKCSKDWRRGNVNSYVAATRNNWLKECCEHMLSQKKRSFNKLLTKKPNNVELCFTFDDWEGIDKKYKFIDKEYGEFESRATNICASWDRGLTGHPERSRIKQLKPLISSENIVYCSSKKAAKEIGANRSILCAVLKGRQKSVKGHTFRYATEEEVELAKKEGRYIE